MIYESYSLWDRLKKRDKSVIIYGTGNGADKIFAALERYGVAVDAVFASGGFVRNRTFRGFTVRSYESIVEEYGNDIIVLLAFGTTLPDVCNFIRWLDEKHELMIPDVPLYGGELFDYKYFLSHREQLNKTASLLCDERSRSIFADAVNFRLTGKMKYLSDTEPSSATLKELFDGVRVETVLDCGAYKGDSTEIFAQILHPKKIYAAEADPKTYLKLCTYAERETRSSVIPVNAVIGSECGSVDYIFSGSRGSGESGQNRRAKMTKINAKTIDSLLDGVPVDLIKLDVEGNEEKALNGAAKTILRFEPSLAVSLYHKTDDLYSLIIKVHEMLPQHELYLRRVPCIPMWDLTLYAIKKA